MATWSADGKELTAEVRAALAPRGEPPPGPVEGHVHIRAGLGSLLGETHLVLSEGRFRIAARPTSFDALTEIELAGRPELDDSGYRPILVVPTPRGLERVEVTALEEDAVEDLLEAIPESAVPSSPASAAEASDPAQVDALHAARRDLLRTFARRIRQRKAELLAARMARTAQRGDARTKHRSSDDRWRARHRPQLAKPTPASAARGPALTLPWVLFLLVTGGAMFGLFSVLGRAISSAR